MVRHSGPINSNWGTPAAAATVRCLPRHCSLPAPLLERRLREGHGRPIYCGAFNHWAPPAGLGDLLATVGANRVRRGACPTTPRAMPNAACLSALGLSEAFLAFRGQAACMQLLPACVIT